MIIWDLQYRMRMPLFDPKIWQTKNKEFKKTASKD